MMRSAGLRQVERALEQARPEALAAQSVLHA
jgi:hypothetical protein